MKQTLAWIVVLSIYITTVPLVASAIYFAKCDPRTYPDLRECTPISRGDAASIFGIAIIGEDGKECPVVEAVEPVVEAVEIEKEQVKKGRVVSFFGRIVSVLTYNPFK